MRRALIGVLGALLLLAVAGSAPAGLRGSPDARTLALNTAKVDLTTALTLEKRAVQDWRVDHTAAAKKDLREAIDALDAMEAAAKELTPPLDLSKDADATKPPDPWAIFNTRRLLAAYEDKDVLSKGFGSGAASLGLANRLKEDLLSAVTHELAHPDCSGVINLQGPPVVNGVALGHSQLTVEFSCKEPVKSIYVDVPTDAIVQAVGDTGDTATVRSGSIVEIDVNGAKSGGVTLETSPDASQGAPVDADVVPIAGDSVEYFQDVM